MQFWTHFWGQKSQYMSCEQMSAPGLAVIGQAKEGKMVSDRVRGKL